MFFLFVVFQLCAGFDLFAPGEVGFCWNPLDFAVTQNFPPQEFCSPLGRIVERLGFEVFSVREMLRIGRKKIALLLYNMKGEVIEQDLFWKEKVISELENQVELVLLISLKRWVLRGVNDCTLILRTSLFNKIICGSEMSNIKSSFQRGVCNLSSTSCLPMWKGMFFLLQKSLDNFQEIVMIVADSYKEPLL